MVAFYLPGGIPVYGYSLLMAVGVFTGMTWVVWQSSEKETPRKLEAGLWALLGGLIGGRSMFVAFNWGYYQAHLWESLQVYQGGLSWPGALAGGLVTLALYTGLTRQSLLEMADNLNPLLACIAVCAWLGCWLDGCAYGAVTSPGWGLPASDEWGQVSPRWPVQLIGALFTVGFFWSSERAMRRGDFKPGTLACLGLLNLSLISFGLSLLRVDPAPVWHGLRLDAWAALFFAIPALVVLCLLYRRRKEMV